MSVIKKNEANENSENRIYYVGIGASAGGLEALRPFVANLPTNANMTYIIAQHMSPDHPSLMVELLSRETSLSVEEAKNHLVPKPNTIYVAPSNTDITIVKNELNLSKPTNTIGPKPSVDRFFISLASEQEEYAVGIILSGTGSDGAHGIKAIKATGGITIAQNPNSAKYDSMPNAAIRIGGADLVLSPSQIAKELATIITRPITIETQETEPITNLRSIVHLIAVHTGMDFSNYKDATLSRQITRRMTAKQIPNLEQYGQYLTENSDELLELVNNFLICVTSFFRDADAFIALQEVFTNLISEKKANDEIRIWVPGCATGEEVYTIAILLSEILGDNLTKHQVQIFATDINQDAVQMARQGIYPEIALSEIPEHLIKKYFIAKDGMYCIHKKIKDMVLFARQDLVQDPPFVRLDLISCRNLLIYFKTDLQDRVLKIFHYSLRDKGILFLGKSETVGRQSNLFSEKDRKYKIYIKRPVSTPPLGSFSRNRALLDKDYLLIEKYNAIPAEVLAQNRLFEIYSPPSLLVSESGEIIELFGDCSPFLSIKKGKADFNLFSMVKSPFRTELRAFCHRVIRKKESAFGTPTALSIDGHIQLFRLAVHFVARQNSTDSDLLLISFEATKSASTHFSDDDMPSDLEKIQELEQEIVLTRENLQTVIEELETANEELQSLNEEAQAANEELQASNEELETANEELQASNEELITVNDELNSRTQELTIAHDDLNNILNSLYTALVVINKNLQITRYNQIALQFFTIPIGENINIATVHMHCEIPNLLGNIQKVIQKGEIVDEDFSKADKFYLMRIKPYIIQFSANEIAGVIISIEDITSKKIQEENLKLSASVFEHSSEGTIITDSANKIISVNPAFTRISGYSSEDVIGKDPKVLSSGKMDRYFYEKMWNALKTTGLWQGEIENKRKNGEYYIERLSITVLKNDDGNIHRYIAVFSDITDTKKAQKLLEWQANYDALTNLPNRKLITDKLHQYLIESRRSNSLFAVLYMDIDGFKHINDSLGHMIGDELIIKVGKLIKSCIRENDILGRMGGDEFVVLLSDIVHNEDAMIIANKILTEARTSIKIGEHIVQTGLSIGITIYPLDSHSVEGLLKNADNAMYEAKRSGKNHARFYTNQMQDEANKRHWIHQELSFALQRKQMNLCYQPVIDLADMSLHGAEALMRWTHPQKGLISPEAFIPIAEHNGLIIELSDWLFQQALEDVKQCDKPLNIALNISIAQFVSQNHIERLIALLKENPLVQQQRLTLEITESMRCLVNEEYRSILYRFKDCGCKLAIDDFGTGYSSLSYLKQIPVDILKIDKSFIKDITFNQANDSMVKAILQISDAFNLVTIAEGIETEEQLSFLKQEGCHFAQGFLFSEALAINKFNQFLNRF